jgi:hypothetical protein
MNPCQHPIVILKDVKYSDLKTMVDFMYYGEVNVSQEQLPAILKVLCVCVCIYILVIFCSGMFYVCNFESAVGPNRKHLWLHVATLKLHV